MKALLYSFSILVVGCMPSGENERQRSAFEHTDTLERSPELVVDTAVIDEAQPELDSLESLEIFKIFALDYFPKHELGAKLPETPNTVLQAIDVVKVSHPKEYEKYLVLIFMKLYGAHMECCHQSYEVRKQTLGGLDRKKDPLVYEFNGLTKYFPEEKPIELFSSHLAHEYVLANKHLLNFPPIKEQFEAIEQVHKNIDEGVYWK